MVPLPSAGSSGVGFWTALLDAEVSHKSLVSLLYCLTERPKQVSLLKCYNKLCPPSLVSGLQYLGGDSVRRPKNEATDFVVWHVARFHFISFFFQTFTDRLSAIYAAQLYLVLLQMPGQ